NEERATRSTTTAQRGVRYPPTRKSYSRRPPDRGSAMHRRERPALGPAVRLFAMTVFVAAGLASAGVPARAGLASLTKSAKDKATRAVTPSPSGAKGAPPRFDATSVELTGDVLDKLIACRKAANDATKDRQKLVDRSNQIQKELNDLQAKNND